MKNAQDLQALLPALEAIPPGDLVMPSMPVATFLQEAEDLNAWLQPDRAALEAHGQPPALLESLPARIGALREAESAWNAARFDREQAQADYEELSAQALDEFAQCVRHFRYAFRKHPGLLARLPSGTGWATDAERIQELNNLAVLGREHVELLAAAGFDPALLDDLAATSDLLADKCALARGERASGRGSKVLRDRAYTHLKDAVDEIRAAGRFLFWTDEVRLAGYRSEYMRKSRAKADGNGAEDTQDTAPDAQDAALPDQGAEPAPRTAAA